MSGLAAVAAEWNPEPVTTTGATTAWTVFAVSGLFDLDPVADDGEPLPPIWHWFGFLVHPRHDQLGDNGHPPAGHFLPPIPDRARMITGGRLRVTDPMRTRPLVSKPTSTPQQEVAP